MEWIVKVIRAENGSLKKNHSHVFDPKHKPKEKGNKQS